jgi:predicted ribosome quality control (RQC) complex YloA/Tae2 family protein
MDGNLFEKLFSRIAGRTPTDEVDAATIAAELTAMRESATGLAAERDSLASQVTELTEQLEKTKSKVSEYEAAEEDRRKADLTAKVATAIAEGRLHMGLKEEAEKDPERFLAAAEKTPKGLYSPPKGRVVTDGAIESAEGNLGEMPREVFASEIELYAKEHKVSMADAYIAVVKAQSLTAAGKGA